MKHFGDEYGVRGSRFGDMFGRSKHVPKSVAIHQESLISHLGIIETPKTPDHYNKKPRKNKQTYFRRRILGPIRSSFWPPLDPTAQCALKPTKL